MTVTQLKKLTIFHLNETEFNNADVKNSCLVQTQTSYVAYVLNSAVEDKELLSQVGEKDSTTSADLGERLPVVYLSGGVKGLEARAIDYVGMMELVSASVVAVLFPKRLIWETGGFHPMLSAKNNYEFLCRMARATGQCRVFFLTGGVDIHGEEEMPDAGGAALTLAYVIRRHMNDLHTLGATDRVLTTFYEYARTKNAFQEFQQNLNLFLSDPRLYGKYARETAPFIVLRGDDTCGGVLQGFADDLAEALWKNGQAVIMVDEDFARHEELQGMVCKGIVGFQSKALEIDFFRKINGPKFQFWFDNPLHFMNVLRNLPEEYFVLCQDANYAALVREYYHTPNAIQFPPGGRLPRGCFQEEISSFSVRKMNGEVITAAQGMLSEENQQACGQREGQSYGSGEGQHQRPYDIVFMGNYFPDGPEILSGFEREFYDYMLFHPCETFEQGLTELMRLQDSGTACRGQGAAELAEQGEQQSFVQLSDSMKPACRMVIGHFRNAVVSAILGAGFDLHVYGDGWKDYKGAGREHLKIHPLATVEESLQELSKAKIGLNIMSWHKAGMTERIANIMLSGAVCLSEETTYLREHMQEGEEIVTFRLDCLEDLPEKIQDLLDHPALREEIAEKARRRAMAEYTWESRARELIALSGQAMQDALTIYVATHVKFDPPKDPVYVPLHVGKKGKPDLGYPGDDTGENISDLNFLYGELTGLFWIWQNVHDVDYVGLCHYRRYFINARKEAMGKREYLELLGQYDAILPRHMECEGSYYQHFGMSHNRRDLDAVGRALKRIYPSYGEAYDQAMEGAIYYWGNLVVTSLSVLKAYAEWLFQIFVEASEEIDVSGYDDYHRRVYGFLSEQMFYVFALANGLNCCEAAVGVSEEKAETRALKEELEQLIGEGREKEAKELFREQLTARPDLLLPGSDVKGELQALYGRLLG